MKKLSTLTILFIFFNLIQANSQTPDWVWARSAQSGITGWGEAVSIATDQSENIFVAGQYRDTIIFGSHVLTGAQEGVYLTKYDTYGNIKWAKGDISANILNCWTGGICTDSSGNCYLVGYFNDTVSFDSFTLISSGINDAIFLVKYDPSGNVLWAKSAGGSGMDDCYGVTTDPWGNIYLTGNYGSSLFVLDWDTLINTGSGTNIFVAKYDSSGNLLWAKNAVGTGQDRGYSVATDVLGNVILTGSFYSHIITFGPYVLNHVNGSGANIFVVKYDSSGNILWANKAGGTNDDIAYHVITDALGNIYVTGYFSSWPMLFGTDTLFLAGNVDVFLVKYNPFGSIAWVKSFGNDSEEGYCVTTDKYGRIYLTGFFHSTITIDTIPLQLPTGTTDAMFIVGYDSSGHALFAKGLPSGGNYTNAIAIGISGSIYIGSHFQPSSFIVGNDTLIRAGTDENMFVAKLNSIPENIPEITPNQQYTLYPNPFNNQLTVTTNLPDATEITIFDITSRKILHQRFQNSTVINTEQLAQGVYFYEVRGMNGIVERGKLVKQD